MYVDGNEHVHRGCYYEASDAIRDECGPNSDMCTICNNSDCNRDPYYPRPLTIRSRRRRRMVIQTQRKCLRCNSNYDIQCRLNPHRFESIECAGNQCATYISANQTLIRDCAENLEDVASTKTIENGNLITCDSNDNCNDITSDKHYCFQCDSRSDPNCAASINTAMLTLCPYAADDFGCYHRQTGKWFLQHILDYSNKSYCCHSTIHWELCHIFHSRGVHDSRLSNQFSGHGNKAEMFIE